MDLADCGKLDEALEVHAQLWEAHPDESRFGLHRFNSQLNQGDTTAARQTLALLAMRRFADAEARFRQVLEIDRGGRPTGPLIPRVRVRRPYTLGEKAQLKRLSATMSSPRGAK